MKFYTVLYKAPKSTSWGVYLNTRVFEAACDFAEQLHRNGGLGSVAIVLNENSKCVASYPRRKK